MILLIILQHFLPFNCAGGVGNVEVEEAGRQWHTEGYE